MIVKDIYNIMDEEYNFKFQENWDNSGLIIGNMNNEVNKIMLALDVTDEVLCEAVEEKVDLIITHHPFIFRPIKRIDENTFHGRIIYKLIKNKISVISAHTNMDSASYSLNEFFGELLFLKNMKKLDKMDNNQVREIGIVGEIDDYKLRDLLMDVSKLLKSNCSFVGDIEKDVKRVSIVTGAGSDFIKKASEVSDVFITGDIKYHEARLVEELGFNLINCGHYEMERIFLIKLKEVLIERMNNQYISVIISKKEVSPFKYI